MKTIVHVVEATATGTLSMVCTAANALAKQGNTVHVVYSLRPETPNNLAQMFHPSVILHKLQMNGAAGIRSIPVLRKLLLRINPDIVHMHSSFAGFLGRIATIGILPDAKLFYSPHCISMMREDIHYKKYIFAALERLANLRACTYLACSESESKAIEHWVGADAPVLENAVDMPRSYSQDMVTATATKEGSPFTIITVGGIRPQKNPTLFSQICMKCKQMGINVRFMWVGDGDSDLVHQLENAGVEVTGWKTKEEITGLLARSNVYLSTSRWEGMPVSVIEAMASGTLVLATRCAGNVDVVEHRLTGLLFQTPDEACGLICAMVDGRISAYAIITYALNQSKNRFSLQRFSDQINKIYFPSPDRDITSP
jgi:glycosyltransferase involved in cell wall biosynthesis